jgi:hypothetical protein
MSRTSSSLRVGIETSQRIELVGRKCGLEGVWTFGTNDSQHGRRRGRGQRGAAGQRGYGSENGKARWQRQTRKARQAQKMFIKGFPGEFRSTIKFLFHVEFRDEYLQALL